MGSFGRKKVTRGFKAKVWGRRRDMMPREPIVIMSPWHLVDDDGASTISALKCRFRFWFLTLLQQQG